MSQVAQALVVSDYAQRAPHPKLHVNRLFFGQFESRPDLPVRPLSWADRKTFAGTG